jgi:hypothetical protein
MPGRIAELLLKGFVSVIHDILLMIEIAIKTVSLRFKMQGHIQNITDILDR